MVSPKEDDSIRYSSVDDPFYYMISSNGGNAPSGSSHRRSQELIEPDPRGTNIFNINSLQSFSKMSVDGKFSGSFQNR